jgi:hypothetical protein
MVDFSGNRKLNVMPKLRLIDIERRRMRKVRVRLRRRVKGETSSAVKITELPTQVFCFPSSPLD